MKTSCLQALALSLPLMLVAGCGSGTTHIPPAASCTPASPPAHAYVLNSGANTISMYSMDSCSGTLTQTSPSSIPTGANSFGSEQMVVDPGGRFAYVANLGSNAQDLGTISMFTINSTTGILTPTTPPTVPTGFLPQGIGIDPAGKFVYTANSDDNSISMFTVNASTGILTPTTPASVPAGWSPNSITVDPSGRFAYAANQNDGTISMYNVNPTTGVLTPMVPATVSAGGSPFGVTVTPSGKFAYVPNAYGNNDVSEYTVDANTGVLTPTAQISAHVGNSPTDVAVHPSSNFAYVVNRQDNSLSAFTVAGTGDLSPLNTLPTGQQPFRAVVDPTGQFVYVANETGSVSIYSIKADGSLTASQTAATSGAAVSLAITAAKK